MFRILREASPAARVAPRSVLDLIQPQFHLPLFFAGFLLPRRIYVEFKEKARSLHECITKHWIARELALLQRCIDQANEKGWRRELAGYMDKLMLLREPSEQSRLLLEVPEIKPEEPEVDPAEMEPNIELADMELKVEPADEKPEAGSADKDSWVKPADKDSWVKPADKEIKVESANEGSLVKDEQDLRSPGGNGTYSCPDDTSDFSEQMRQSEESKCAHTNCHENSDNGMGRAESCESYVEVKYEFEAFKLEPLLSSSLGQSNFPIEKQHLPDNSSYGEKKAETTNVEHRKAKSNRSATSVEINNISDDMEKINLSDDDEEEKGKSVPVSKKTPENLNASIWYCVSPLGGAVLGPYGISVLKEWSNNCPRDLEFKVWKKGQNPEEAVLLTDVVHQVMF